MIAKLNKIQSEPLNQLKNQEKNSNNESREGIKKMNLETDTSTPTNNEQVKTDTESEKRIVLELKKEMMEQKLSMMAELNKIQSEPLNQFINQQKKSNNESIVGIKKMLLNRLDTKFGEFEIEM